MNKISRRNFIRASALSALGAAAAGALSGCSNNAASSSAASSVASSAAASEQPAAAASSITWDDIFATSYSQANRRSNPDAKAPETPEEYIEQKGNGDIMGSMMVGMVDSLNIPEEQFMNNKPAWLGDEPQLAGQTICFESCDAVFVSMVRRCMEDIPLRWLMVPDFEKEYVRMLAGKCLFLSPVRSHGYPPEWFHPLIFPFPPAPTCLFTRKDDTRPCLQVLRQLTLAEHQRAVADGRL